MDQEREDYAEHVEPRRPWPQDDRLPGILGVIILSGLVTLCALFLLQYLIR